jgi:hypothetical protein
MLKTGGHFVCKFYQGAEDKELEKRLRGMFDKVFRDKPESSRKVSPHPRYPSAHGRNHSCSSRLVGPITLLPGRLLK